jgi:DNA-binding response OmpR family regulator
MYSKMNLILNTIVFYFIIVEDSKSDHAFLRQAIHTVVPQAIVDSIYNEEEALKFFGDCKSVPNLIFLDEDMLKISGKSTIETIKKIEGLAHVPLIFLSNTINEEQKKEFINQGVSDFYTKPYKPLDLVNIVGAVNKKWLA